MGRGIICSWPELPAVASFGWWLLGHPRHQIPNSPCNHRRSRIRTSWNMSARRRESTRHQFRRRICKWRAVSTPLCPCDEELLLSLLSLHSCHRRWNGKKKKNDGKYVRFGNDLHIDWTNILGISMWYPLMLSFNDLTFKYISGLKFFCKAFCWR